MGKLIYGSNMSLDGWTEDAAGNLAWAPPDDDVFAAITEMMRSAGTYLYGRLMYETMAVWETDPELAAGSEARAEFARVWQAPAKVVYSSTLGSPLTANTRIERAFDADAVAAMKAAADHDLLVGGPNLAGQAMAAGLVDEVQLYVWPIVLGGQNPAIQPTQRVDLELVDEHRFDSGVVHLRYQVR